MMIFAPMDETLEVRLFSIQDVPWGNIAFSSVTFALEKYVDDYNNGVSIPESAELEGTFVKLIVERQKAIIKSLIML